MIKWNQELPCPPQSHENSPLLQLLSALPRSCQGESGGGKGKILKRKINGPGKQCCCCCSSHGCHGNQGEEEEEEGGRLIDSPVLAHLASIHVQLQRERKSKNHTQGSWGSDSIHGSSLINSLLEGG